VTEHVSITLFFSFEPDLEKCPLPVTAIYNALH